MSAKELRAAFSDKASVSYSWARESAMLIAPMFVNFADRGRHRPLLSNYPRWGYMPTPWLKGEVNFDNYFYRIAAADAIYGKMRCVRAKKSPRNNCYKSARGYLEIQ